MIKTRTSTIRLELVIITLVSVLACARSSTLPTPESPSPQPIIPEVPQPVSREGNTSKSWRFSPTPELQNYNTLITTSIQQSTGAIVLLDTVITRAQYSLGLMRSAAEISLTGSIQNFTVQAGNRIGANVPISSFPLSFTGHFQNHQLELDIKDGHSASSSLPCNAPARSALTAIQRNLFITPLELQAAMTWQDSLSSTSCSGDLAINLTILRTYKVVGESSFNGISTIVIDVSEKTLSTGEGSQDQHRIIVNGQGLKSGRFYIDISTGSLVSVSSETHTTLQIQSSGKTQQFLQNSREITTRM